jgi:hypothetical protein
MRGTILTIVLITLSGWFLWQQPELIKRWVGFDPLDSVRLIIADIPSLANNSQPLIAAPSGAKRDILGLRLGMSLKQIEPLCEISSPASFLRKMYALSKFVAEMVFCKRKDSQRNLQLVLSSPYTENKIVSITANISAELYDNSCDKFIDSVRRDFSIGEPKKGKGGFFIWELEGTTYLRAFCSRDWQDTVKMAGAGNVQIQLVDPGAAKAYERQSIEAEKQFKQTPHY